MKERRKNERRRWGRKVTYPFIDSDGVLVTKNRRRKVDRREVSEEEEVAQDKQSPAPVAAKESQEVKNTSVDLSDSRVLELEEALQDDDPASSNIASSIKDLEEEILDATNTEAVANNKIQDIEEMDESAEIEFTPEELEPQAPQPELPEPTLAANSKEPETSIELFLKGEKHVVTGDNKESCQVGRDPSCDIIVQGKFVSRAHAKIVFKKGKFFLEDNSFNGTYIKFDNGQKIHVSKDEQTLVANGVMSMGKPVDDKSKSVISFKINQ